MRFLLLFVTLSAFLAAPAGAAAKHDETPARVYSPAEFVTTAGNLLVFRTASGFEMVPFGDISLNALPFTVEQVDLRTTMPGILGSSVTLITGPTADHVAHMLALSTALDGITEQLVSDPQKYTSNYVDADGINHTVETPRRPRESVQDWVKRHQEALAAFRGAFPPAPPRRT